MERVTQNTVDIIPTIERNNKGSRSVIRGFTGKFRGVQNRLPKL